MQHESVLLEEIIAIFKDLEISTFLDGTVGAGGHASQILTEHPEIQQYMGIDQDPLAQSLSGEKLSPWKEKVALIRGNFSDFEDHLAVLGLNRVDAILLDLGVSSMQLDQAEKGFSFSKDGPLDMRMDPSNPLTAADIVNTWSEQELARIFRDYGEEKQWRSAARLVVRSRQQAPFRSTLDLVHALEPSLRFRAKRGIHPLTLIFQALRIAVNDELQRVERALPKMIERLNPGGRLAVISFHSLEDRIVKNAFRYASSDKESTRGFGGVFISKTPSVKPLTGKPIVASAEEIANNPRSRSAKLRAIEKR